MTELIPEGNRLLTKEELSRSIQKDLDVLNKRKRGGRKPGSKNKPKQVQVAHVDLQFDRQEIELTNLRYGVKLALRVLEEAAAIRISQMDSESRVADLSRRQQMLVAQALEALKAAM